MSLALFIYLFFSLRPAYLSAAYILICLWFQIPWKYNGQTHFYKIQRQRREVGPLPFISAMNKICSFLYIETKYMPPDSKFRIL